MDVRAYVDRLRNDPHVKGKYLSQLFPKQIVDSSFYRFYRYRQCIACKKTIEQYDMEPPDKTCPRAFHTKCFNRLAVRISKKCIICKSILSNDKIAGQSHSPDDSYYRLCDGYCIDYFSILSCKTFGDDLTFLADELELQPLHRKKPSQKSNMRRPQLKSRPGYLVPEDHNRFPILKEIAGSLLNAAEIAFFHSGQMNIEEKGHFLIKIDVESKLRKLAGELFYASDETQINIFMLKFKEYLARFKELENNLPSARYPK